MVLYPIGPGSTVIRQQIIWVTDIRPLFSPPSGCTRPRHLRTGRPLRVVVVLPAEALGRFGLPWAGAMSSPSVVRRMSMVKIIGTFTVSSQIKDPPIVLLSLSSCFVNRQAMKLGEQTIPPARRLVVELVLPHRLSAPSSCSG